MKTFELFTIEDCRQDIDVWNINLDGLYVILKPEFFKEEFREARYQLVKCCGGFGCDPASLGNAIFVREMQKDNPESYRIERYNRNILGVASEKAIEEFKAKYGWSEEV